MKTCDEWVSDIENKIRVKRKEREIMKARRIKIAGIAACLVIVVTAAFGIPFVANRNNTPAVPNDTTVITNDVTVDDTAGSVGGGSNVCKVHCPELFHTIPGDLCNYIGFDKVNEWGESRTTKEGTIAEEDKCLNPEFTIVNFIEYFDITREQFIDNTNFLTKTKYDVDILYSGDAEVIEEYFTNNELYEINRSKTENYWNLSITLNEMHWKATNIQGSISIVEAVTELGIKREDLEKMIEDCKEKNYEAYGVSETFDYDIDSLYSEDVLSIYKIDSYGEEKTGERALSLDAIFCRMNEN